MADVRVDLREDELRQVPRETYVRDELVRRARPIEAQAKRRAPRSKTGSHGRPAGYLASRIRLRVGLDSLSWRVDIVSDATAPGGFPYGRVMEGRRPYLRPSLPR